RERHGVDVAAVLVPGSPAQRRRLRRDQLAPWRELPDAGDLVIADGEQMLAVRSEPQHIAGAATGAGIDDQPRRVVFAAASGALAVRKTGHQEADGADGEAKDGCGSAHARDPQEGVFIVLGAFAEERVGTFIIRAPWRKKSSLPLKSW